MRRAAVALGAMAIAATTLGACSLLRDTDYLADGEPDATVETSSDRQDVGPMPDADSGATRTRVPVAGAQPGARLLVQDDAAIYWLTNDGSVLALQKDGSETMPRLVGNVGASVTFLAAEPGSGPSLFYTTGLEVRKIPKAGGASAPVGTTTPAPRAVVVDSTHVFASADSDTIASVTRFTHDGSEKAILHFTDVSYVVAVALEGPDVFWDTFESEFQSVPKNTAADAGTPVSYVPISDEDESSVTPHAFAVDQQAFYYSNGTDVRSFKRSGGTPVQLIAFPATSEVRAIAIDDRHVYAVDSVGGGTLRRTQKDGLGVPELMLDGLEKPTSLVVTDKEVYVSLEGPPGAIVKCAK